MQHRLRPLLASAFRVKQAIPPALAAFAAVTTAACASTPPKAPQSAAASQTAPPAAIPFIEDDYAHAVSEARAAHKLLFVDAWAPWCHTCLSMKAYTFRDAKVRARAGDLVWAAIDTEKPVNAEWVAAHPMRAWPTLFVVDAESGENGKTILEWANSATPDELVRLLDVAQAAKHHEGVLAKAEERALEGTAAAAAGKAPEAIAAWRDALAVAPEGWPGRAATVESLIDRLYANKTSQDDAACVEVADRELPTVKRGGARAATLAVMCAQRLPASSARRQELERAIERAHALAVDEAEPMLPDDRSGLYEVIVDALGEPGADARPDQAKSAAREWATFLEGEAARAPDTTARAVFDAHRVEAYLAIGAPERAIPMLEASARELPNDYNPPARLARVYLAMKRYDDALTAIDRALGLVYGPRALRLVATKADVLEAKGDRAAAAATLKDGVARAGATLPPRYAPLAKELIQREHSLEASH
jgi:tetratricopeptide (TPR) repeat protein